MTATTPAADRPETAPAAEQAEHEATEAEQLLAALEERVRDGDEKVTAQQLADARELGRFAKLRAEAARRKADRAAAKAAEQERTRLTAQAVALVDQQADPATVAAAYDTARQAVADLLAAATGHDDALREAAALLRQAGAPPITEHHPVQRDGMTFQEPRRMPASRTAPRVHHGNGEAALALDDDRTRQAIGPGALLAVLVAEATAGDAGRMPPGEPHLAAAPIREHAARHRDRVRALMSPTTKSGK
ncbi:hypothetical protein [Streptomyces albus]|uniref:hypothetical protein n=1 Tax=unclassified Streptomyces TaxID=2593676 RepID=UPI0004BDF703|nr:MULTISPECIES: hypothetical protein [unclassified Streptomyces]KPC91905.1 hypothetical protein ADL27_27285 [Streptomyces sp. NRRL F-6602]